MRWGSSDIRFARPVHWIVAIYGGKVVPLELGDIKSGDTSRGHRFMSPESLPVKDFADYSKKMRDAYVIVDPKERKGMILKETARIISFTSGRILEDEKLLNLLTYLVEYPTAICGTFDKEFLRLPREVLIACMREHQKYFSVVDKDGNLLPNFVAINNTLPQDPEVAIKGNERVLKARLSDARFFFEEDRKIPLAGWVEKLRGVLFQENLGSYHEKIERLQKLAEYLAEEVNPVIKKKVKRASLLCKADLVTGMVGEFPGLQGVMGREYALLSKEEKEVAKAIREHYFPAFAGDILPSSQTGALLSIADKTDTIVGCFGVNLLPTGAADPYALRRQALGIINIVLENKYSLSLHKLLNKSLSLLEDKIARKPLEVKRDVQEFFRIRFKNLLIPKGFPPEVVEAVTLVSFDNLVDVFEKIKAVDEFRSHPDFESLVTAFKRASRIIEKSPLQEVDATLFESSEEGRLFKVYRDVQNKVGELFEGERYRDALTEIVKLKEPIDTFFDRVMVMAEEREIRENRLALLGGIVNLFMNIADFSRIATSREKEG
jgi:glycyl-tRNA synthetase beta chain